MLKALYAYAVRRKLALPPGYVNKSVKAYISLSSAKADYVSVQLGDDEEIPCPDIGSAANGKSSCNALACRDTPRDQRKKRVFSGILTFRERI